MELSRDFKGIWIPKEIWLHRSLSMSGKMLWSEIHSLYSKDKGGCFATNEYLMDFMGLKRSRFLEVIKELKNFGLLIQVSFDGRNRVLKAIQPIDAGQQTTGKPDDSSPENRTPPIIYEVLDEGIDSSCPHTTEPPAVSKKETITPPFDAIRLAEFLFSRIQQNDPRAKKSEKQIHQWSLDLDKMFRLDGYLWHDIENLIVYATEDEFWKSNILSASKLREKAQQLTIRMNQQKPKEQKINELDSRMKKNWDLADMYLSIAQMDGHQFYLSKHSAKLKVNGEIVEIRLDEHGFKDQITSALRKMGVNIE